MVQCRQYPTTRFDAQHSKLFEPARALLSTNTSTELYREVCHSVVTVFAYGEVRAQSLKKLSGSPHLHIRGMETCDSIQDDVSRNKGLLRPLRRVVAHSLLWHHDTSYERSFWCSLAATMHQALSGGPIHSGTTLSSCSTHKQFKPAMFLRYQRDSDRTSSSAARTQPVH